MDGTGNIENGTVTVHRLPLIQAHPRIHPTHIGGVRGIDVRNTHGTSTVVLSDFVRETLIRVQTPNTNADTRKSAKVAHLYQPIVRAVE